MRAFLMVVLVASEIGGFDGRKNGGFIGRSNWRFSRLLKLVVLVASALPILPTPKNRGPSGVPRPASGGVSLAVGRVSAPGVDVRCGRVSVERARRCPRRASMSAAGACLSSGRVDVRCGCVSFAPSVGCPRRGVTFASSVWCPRRGLGVRAVGRVSAPWRVARAVRRASGRVARASGAGGGVGSGEGGGKSKSTTGRFPLVYDERLTSDAFQVSSTGKSYDR